MIIDRKLSLSEKASARKKYQFFTATNGVSYFCLADNIIILFALKLNFPDYYVALLSSFAYLGLIMIIFGKFLVRRMGAVNTLGVTWILRNMFGLLAASTPLWLDLSPALAMAILTLGVLGFQSSRGAGIVSGQPILGEITNGNNRGRLIAANFWSFNIASLFTLLAITAIIRHSQTISTFAGIMIFGAAAGIIGALVMLTAKESRAPQISAGKTMKESFVKAWCDLRIRRMFIANFAIYFGIALVLPISMLALKEIYKVSDFNALLFVIVQMLGGVGVSYLSKVIAEETGPRPLVILYFATLLVISAIWLAVPRYFLWYLPAAVFLGCGICQMGVGLALGHYFLIVVPDQYRVGTNILNQVSAGLGGAIGGAALAAGLLKILHMMNIDAYLIYKVYFGVVLLMLFICLYFVSRLKNVKDWKIRQVLNLAFSPRDFRALYFLHKLETVPSPDEEKEQIEKLVRIGSELSEKSLLSSLESPKFFIRSTALDAFRHVPFGKDAEEAIIRELEEGEFTTAYLSAIIAGDKKLYNAIPQLRKALNSKDHFLKGKCLVALAQLHDEPSFKKIENIFRKTHNPRLVIHGAAALVEIGDPEALELLLNKSLDKKIPPAAVQEVIYSIAEIAGIGPEIYKIIKIGKNSHEMAADVIQEFLVKLSDHPFDAVFKKQIGEFSNGKISRTELIKALLKQLEPHHRKIIETTAGFLRKADPETLSIQLIYCILATCRKHGGF